MFTVAKNFHPLIKLLVASIITLVAFLIVKNYTLQSINTYEEYRSFSVIVEQVSRNTCEINVYEDSSPVDCYRVQFTDPTNGSKQILEIASENYQVGEGTEIDRGEIIRVNKVEADNQIIYVFTGFDRTLVYFIMFAIFIATVVLIAGKRGLRSVFSLALSVAIIGKIIIPLILAGHDPILVASGIGFLMLAIQLYITNGVNKQTTISVLGSLIGVIAAVIFAKLFSNMANITGYGDENSGFISLNAPNNISVKDLIIGSFILGVLGVVDDATVSQVAVVAQLKKNNPKIKKTELFKSAMDVGSSHIGSLMNTLFLAYVASALPLITLLFIYNPTLREIINIDLFTEEIIRTIVGSLGLVLSIPASTYLAVSMLRKKDVENMDHHHGHTH